MMFSTVMAPKHKLPMDVTPSSGSKKRGRPRNSGGSHDASVSILIRPLRLFAAAMSEHGDVTKAYLESHPTCPSPTRAKYAGRALLKRGDVRALIAIAKAKALSDQPDSNPHKSALLAEVELMA